MTNFQNKFNTQKQHAIIARVAQPLTTAQAARDYIHYLIDLDLIYQLNDPAADVIDLKSNAPFFTPHLSKLLDTRADEIFDLLGGSEPFDIILDSINQ